MPQFSQSDSTAYVASVVVKASQGRVFQVVGYNSGPDQWIHLFNSTTLPADAAVPKRIFRVFGDRNFSFDIPGDGLDFTAGIVICNSTTGPTKTIGAADCWFNVIYL